MLNSSSKRPLVLILAGIMFLTFCFAQPADAVIFAVPALVIGIVAAVGGIGIAIKDAMKSADEKRSTRQEKPPEQNKAEELKPTVAASAPGQG